MFAIKLHEKVQFPNISKLLLHTQGNIIYPIQVTNDFVIMDAYKYNSSRVY